MPETQEAFEAKARSEQWRCSRCGQPITFADKETFHEAGRCRQCHYELDTESGSVGRL